MEDLLMNEFRRQVGEYINQTYYAGKTFVLIKGEKKVAAMVPIATLNRLRELEDFYTRTMADQEQTGSTNNEGVHLNESLNPI